MTTSPKSKRRWPLELAFAIVLILCFWLPRFYLAIKVPLGWSPASPLTLLNLMLFDLVVVGYFLIPWFIFSLIWPFRWRRGGWLFSYITFSVFLCLLVCISEFFFIDEFSSRYNFIAVDYLVYTSEVLQNIWESYPIVPIMLALVALSIAISWWLKRFSHRLSATVKLILLIVFISLAFFVNQNERLDALNESQKEFAKNSFHALFAAFRNNQIDYNKFYVTLPEQEAFAITHRELLKDFSNSEIPKNGVEDPQSLIENLKRSVAPKHANVMFVLMESMSAKYLKAYGPGEGLTPNLDRLFENGLTFDHLYATGTRTVRGLEAVLLSLPPTPGQSILRRPHSENLFTLGTVLKNQGYDLSFIYGGHAFFDNMREFFESNEFAVLDQGEFSSDQVHFSNAWGICDEDVFDFAIRHANEMHGKPFFQLILTTSNHRPYTFPAGRINRQSGTGRESAVKYSDWSIGHFLSEAKKQPWFDNTIFVFVADHDAAVAGGTRILPSDYRIPFIVYAPKLIKPQRVSLLSSQMDVAPTLLGLLGISYQSRFYGHDLLHAKNERAFLGTYQKLAYMEKGRMVILSPPKKWEEYKLTDEKPELVRRGTGLDPQDDFLKTIVAYYQSASDSFSKRVIGLENTFSANLNVRLFGR